MNPYSWFVSLRRSFHAKPKRLKKPVISVGNIHFGGTGKTPLVIRIAKEFRQLGYRPSILSRGYKRKSKGFVLVSDGEDVLVPVEEAGDEPYMMARMLPKTIVAVDKNRFRAGSYVEETFPIHFHILDDGFQYAPLHRDLDILVIPWDRLHKGAKRESLKALHRAHLIVLTGEGSPEEIQEVQKQVHHYALHSEVYHLPLLPGGFFSLDNKPLDKKWVQKHRWVALAGIAHPQRFLDTLEKEGVFPVESFFFPDHYWPKPKDSPVILGAVHHQQAYGLVTTDKDIAKWGHLSVPIISLRVMAPILPEKFMARIRRILHP